MNNAAIAVGASVEVVEWRHGMTDTSAASEFGDRRLDIGRSSGSEMVDAGAGVLEARHLEAAVAAGKQLEMEFVALMLRR